MGSCPSSLGVSFDMIFLSVLQVNLSCRASHKNALILFGTLLPYLPHQSSYMSRLSQLASSYPILYHFLLIYISLGQGRIYFIGLNNFPPSIQCTCSWTYVAESLHPICIFCHRFNLNSPSQLQFVRKLKFISLVR